MKNIGFITAGILFGMFCSCIELETLPTPSAEARVEFSNEIRPAAKMKSKERESFPPLATKSLIDAQTSRHIISNFLRVDEIVDDTDNSGTYDFNSWEDGLVMEASVISSPGNKDDDYMRSVYLNPVQSYNFTQTEEEQTGEKDSLFYHTRMISWYPMTCELHKNQEGIAANTLLYKFNDAYTVNGEGKVCLRFPDLDGKTDIMVSEVREGMHWHNKDYRGGNSSDDLNGQKGVVYRQPFGLYGQNDSQPFYDNCFEYKHYMSAVQIYAFADESAQNAGMWGKINKVIIKNQPGECTVEIPEITEPYIRFRNDDPKVDFSIAGNEKYMRKYGKAVFDESVLTSFELQTDALFGNDTNTDELEIPAESPSLENSSKTDPVYLGYALIAPEKDIMMDIHTESGVFSVTVKADHDNDATTPEVFQSQFVYKVYLNFTTGGTIAAILLNDASGTYFDLSTGMPYGSGENLGYHYKTSNCYIVNPDLPVTEIVDGTEQPVTDAGGNVLHYDGFTFLANTIGNGTDGLLPEYPIKNAGIKPTTAGLIWESDKGLITQVEYMYNYIRFKVNKKKGNAVIGAYDSSNRLLWSWHIWVTGQPEEVNCTLKGDDSSMIPLVIMDRNLGATSPYTPGEDPLPTYGLYYQWGRKDPSMSPATKDYKALSTQTAPYYDFYGNLLEHTGVVTIGEPTIKDAIENPMYIILPTSIPRYYAYDWLYDRQNTLWGNEVYNTKTIFDPCPHGWRVPGNELSTLIIQATEQESNYTFRDNSLIINDNQLVTDHGNQLVFPLAGYKGVDKGISSLTAAWKYVGKKGDYMLKSLNPNGHRERVYISEEKEWYETGADAGNDGDGDEFCYYPFHFYTDYTNRRTAASIRCVKDTYLEGLGKIYAIVNVPEYVLLGKVRMAKFGAQALSSDITDISLKVLHNGSVYQNIKEYGPYTNPHLVDYELPGADAHQYEKIGLYTLECNARNNKGAEHTQNGSVKVVNISELTDIKLYVTDDNYTNAHELTDQFLIGDNVKLSYKINMREKGAGNTTLTDLTYLEGLTRVYVNGVWVKAVMDTETGVFKTVDAIPLTDDLMLEIRMPDGINAIRYKIPGTVDYSNGHGNYISNPNQMADGKIYAISDVNDAKYWYHDGGNNKLGLATLAPDIKKNNLFKYIKTGQGGYFQLYGKNEFLDEEFKTTGPKYIFYPGTGYWNKEEIYFEDTSGDRRITYNNEFIWTTSRNYWKWYVYPVTPSVSYSVPILINE